jgi:polyferredoxin
MIDSQTIPAWFVAITLLLTGWAWALSTKRKLEINYKIFAITFLLEGLVFGIIYQLFIIDVEIRGFFSRLIISMLALSQFVPLIVELHRGGK